MPVVLSGSLGVRLSITLALHLCSSKPGADIVQHGNPSDSCQELVDPPPSLLLAYPRELAHFLVFGLFTLNPLSNCASKVATGGRSTGGGKSSSRSQPPVPSPVDPAVLLPSRVVFCAFLDQLLQSTSAKGLTNTDAQNQQAFINTVSLHLLDIVGGGSTGGPGYEAMSAREAGQSSPANACKVQAWQALCLLCRGLSSDGPSDCTVVDSAAKRAWACLMQSVHHANIRPYIQLFLSRLLSLHPEAGVESLLIPALLDYGQEKYQASSV